MLDGWYCRSMANEAAQAEEEEQAMEESKYKKEYIALKGKLHNLIYENQSYRLALRRNQKLLLQVTRDSSLLLDRLEEYEKNECSTSESDDTEVSEEETFEIKLEPTTKKRKPVDRGRKKQNTLAKKKRTQSAKKQSQPATQPQMVNVDANFDGHMTPEEVERHLQSQSFLDLVPERAPLTVPTEMFSNEPSLDSESNDMIWEMEAFPSNIEEEIISIDYLPEQ
ncbi:unnamed protein product [Ceutorhynchus assimilis]|uniref:INO80 complex subunit E N-terminal domain-containing protein n=1 Tax=Ceutorhynchus assimilis TaxID=467358 RepID=A0A9N9QIU6_9CUCU|nr:unnamed protein product [Ceutorhynchus assimilis]